MLAIRFLCASLLFVLIGCTSTKTSNTARTGTEQLLISNAVDQSLAKVDFSQMAGKKILVEEKYLDSVDKSYIISSIRHHVVHAGGHLTVKPEEADIVLELRSGGVGTDISDAFLGVPGISLPGMVTLPDLKLITRSRQSAFAKLGIVAIDAKTQTELPIGGVSLSMADDNNWFVMGVGPYRQGTMEQEVEMSLGAGSSPMEGVLTSGGVALNRQNATRSAVNGIPLAGSHKGFRRSAANNTSAPRTIAKGPDADETTGRIQLTSGDEAAPVKEAPKTVPAEPPAKTPLEQAPPAGKALFE